MIISRREFRRARAALDLATQIGRTRQRRLLAASLVALVVAAPALADTTNSEGSGSGSEVQAYFPSGPSEGVPHAIEDFAPVTADDLRWPPAGEWLTHRREYGLSGHSPLDQINTENVGELQLAWSWGLNGKRTEVQPLVRDGVMFLNQSGDIIQALDAATGDLLWSYSRKLPDGLFPLSYANRNIALYEDMVIVGTADAHLVALDARTGKIRWDVEVADYKAGYQYTAGPIVADGKIIAPMSGCYVINPGGCWVSAHDPADGREIWRRHTNARPGEDGGDTWAGVPVEERRGGSVWMPPSYDPRTETLYVGTAVPVPWGRAQRDSSTGEEAYTNSTLALDVDTGAVKWARQHIPAGNFDMDTAFERHLVVTDVAPDPQEVRWIADELPQGTRSVVFGMFGKTGIVRAMDPATGDLWWARETYHQTAVTDIDIATGKATLNEDLVAEVGEPVTVCPGLYGGRNWPGTAIDPERGLFFVGYNNVCMDYTLKDVSPETGKYHGSADFSFVHAPDRGPEGEEKVGSVIALDIATGREVWRYDQRAPWYGALLSTGGGLVFGGGVDRTVRAFDADTGNTLWSTRLTNSVQGYPVSYEVDGVQYVAIPSGHGLAFPKLTPELPQPETGAALFVFRLPPSAR